MEEQLKFNFGPENDIEEGYDVPAHPRACTTCGRWTSNNCVTVVCKRCLAVYCAPHAHNHRCDDNIPF